MSRRRRNQKPQPQNQDAEKQKVTGIDVVETDGAEDLAKETAASQKEEISEAASESIGKMPTGNSESIQIESLSEQEERTSASESLQMDYVTSDEPKEKTESVSEAAEEGSSGLEVDWAGPESAKKNSSVRRSEKEALKKEEDAKKEESAVPEKKKEKADAQKEAPKKEEASQKDNEKKAAAPAADTAKKREVPAAARRPAPARKRRRKPSAPDGIELTDTDTEEAKAKREAEEKGWVFPEVKEDEKAPGDDKATKSSAPKKVKNWWYHLKKGVRIAITVLVCFVLFVLGFFHYEYSRLQKDQSAAYTDEYVAKLKEEEDNSSVAKSAEEDMEKNLADVEEADTVKAEGEIFQDSSVYNILLIGTDDRTEKFSTDARGDTCILLSINKNTGKVTLASFERGTGVPVLWGPYEGQWDWLTHTFRYGGAQMMVEEIRDNYLVDVDRYIRINIRTLVKLIDAIGGVDI
ncbi:MAG: LCP family protein, partial [Lachnospiraceae bacterium]